MFDSIQVSTPRYIKSLTFTKNGTLNSRINEHIAQGGLGFFAFLSSPPLKMHHGPPHEGLMKAVAHLDMEMAEDAATALARPPSKLNGESLVQDSHDRWCEARSDLRRGSLLFDGVSSSGGSTMAAMLSMGNDHFSTRGLEEDVQRKVASEQTVFLRAWLPEFREAHILKSTLEWLYRANGPGH